MNAALMAGQNPPLLRTARPGKPAVRIVTMKTRVSEHGGSGIITIGLVPVEPDEAGDLADHARAGWWLESELRHAVLGTLHTWVAWSAGFIEDEADEALQAAIAAVPYQRSVPSTRRNGCLTLR